MAILVLLVSGAIFGGLAYVLLKAGVSTSAEYDRRLASAAKAEGVVVLMRTDTSGSETNYDYPVVSFTTEDGRSVEFEASIRRDPPKHKVGDRVPVFYPREDPSKADIVGTETIGHVVLIGFGILSTVVTLILGITLLQCLFTGECPTVQ